MVWLVIYLYLAGCGLWFAFMRQFYEVHSDTLKMPGNGYIAFCGLFWPGLLLVAAINFIGQGLPGVIGDAE